MGSAVQSSPGEVSPPAGTGAPEQARTVGASLRASGAALLLLLFSAGATLMALGFGDEARRLPLTVGVPLSAMALLNMGVVGVTELRAHGRMLGRRAADAEEPGPVVATEAGLEESTEEGLSFATSLTAVAVVTVLFFFLGLIPTAVIYTLGFMRGIGKERWTKSVAVASLLVLMFWVFRTYLNVRFYRGWLATEGFIPYVLPF